MLVLSGEPGTGKTTVLRRVARDLERAGGRVLWLSDVAPLHAMLSPSREPSAPEPVTPGAWGEALLATLQPRVLAEGVTAVAIDEAQRLEPAELEVLQRLVEVGRTSGMPLAVLLVGQPELDVKLARLADDGAGRAFACRVRLLPLESADVRAYVAYRLERAGSHLDGVFEVGAVERVALHADGIPLVINQLCDAAVHAANEAGHTMVSASAVACRDGAAAGHAPPGGATLARGTKTRARARRPGGDRPPGGFKGAGAARRPWGSFGGDRPPGPRGGGQPEEARALMNAGASPNARDTAGMTPLMVAVVHGHDAVTELLLSAGADVNALDDAGITALMLAANNGRWVVLQRLLQRGANVNAQTRAGWTALIYATWKGHPNVVRRLLEAGADPALVDRTGWTALHYARWRAEDVTRAGTTDPADPSKPDPASAAAAHLRYVELVDLLGRAAKRR